MVQKLKIELRSATSPRAVPAQSARVVPGPVQEHLLKMCCKCRFSGAKHLPLPLPRPTHPACLSSPPRSLHPILPHPTHVKLDDSVRVLSFLETIRMKFFVKNTLITFPLIIRRNLMGGRGSTGDRSPDERRKQERQSSHGPQTDHAPHGRRGSHADPALQVLPSGSCSGHPSTVVRKGVCISPLLQPGLRGFPGSCFPKTHPFLVPDEAAVPLQSTSDARRSGWGPSLRGLGPCELPNPVGSRLGSSRPGPGLLRKALDVAVPP